MTSRSLPSDAIGLCTLLLGFVTGAPALAADYAVGPGQPLATIAEVPWSALEPGDNVLIYWQAQPYREKWVIGRSGTEGAPITIRGVPGPNGELPVIDGQNAVAPADLDYWNEERGVIKIGGSNNPPDSVPAHVVLEGLDVRSARTPYSFTATDGSVADYSENAASIYVERGQHLIIRRCIIRDSGNGLFIGVSDGATQDVLVEGNYVYDNGIEGSYYEHNSYTAAMGITFQFNHYGPLRSGCGGNNLKDRSAGTVVRYNWIEGGNRQLDLVDGEDSPVVVADPRYRSTFVYGNVLVEHDADGNNQILHYGGDSGDEAIYRKGTLYFYNNTVVSQRAGNTTLMRLSTNEEHADCRNNVLYVAADGGYLAMLGEQGALDLSHNWLKSGWVDSHDSFAGTIVDDGTSVTTTPPGFEDESAQDYHLGEASPCLQAGTELPAAALPQHDVVAQYVRHQAGEGRPVDGPLDIGAFERCTTGDCEVPDGGLGGNAQGGWGTGGTGTGASATGGTGAGVASAGAAAVSPAAGEEGGCGCRLSGRRGAGGPGMGAMLLGLASVLLRRRTRDRAVARSRSRC